MSEPRSQHTALVCAGEIQLFDRDMTATIAADVALEAVQRRLAEVNQWLPIDGDPASPVGELVELNSTGPLRLAYGGWRDLLLGVQFTNGRDELVTAGGRAMKNVAGYDLTKFMVGQSGILGRIVTITTRTHRRPVGAILATFEPDVRHLNRLMPTALKPQWALLTASQLLCGYLGDARTLEYYAASLATLAEPKPREVASRSLEEDIAQRFDVFGQPTKEVRYFRASVPPMRIAEFVRLSRPPRWAADVAHGIVVGATEKPVGESARAVGGSVIVEGPKDVTKLAASAATADLIARLRTAFGPDSFLHR